MLSPRRDVGYDWALERAHLWRNSVEHLERSGKLRERAVVDNENAEGKLLNFLAAAGMKRSGMKASVVFPNSDGNSYFRDSVLSCYGSPITLMIAKSAEKLMLKDR